MGLLKQILTLPLAPLRGAIWVAEKVEEEAQNQLYDPILIEQDLLILQEQREDGLIGAAEAEEREEELIQRLIIANNPGL